MVSPMAISSMPASEMISPGPASGISTFFKPSKAKIFTTLARGVDPSARQTATFWPASTEPELKRPIASRPT